MVRDIQLHHALAQLFQLGVLGLHLEARRDRRGARSWRAIAALDLDQAQTARSKGVDRVGGAQLGHSDANFSSRPHDRRAFRHRHIKAVNRQRDHGFRFGRRCAKIAVGDDEVFHSAASFIRLKSSGKWDSADRTG